MNNTASPEDREQQINRGLRWSAARQVVTGLAGTLGALAYTRFITPADLGAFGLAFLVYNGLYLLIQAPVRDAVVYFQEDEEAHTSAAFWLIAAFSAAGVGLVMLLAGPMSRWYSTPQAAELTRVMAVAFCFQALAVVPAGLLLKRFRFALHEGLQTVTQLGLLFGWVGFSALGFGPWSLVIPHFCLSVFWAVATWTAVRFRPCLRPGWPAVRRVFSFSRSLTASNLLVYLSRNLDNAAVGTLGAAALGWYSFGEDQASYVGMTVGATIAQVALPALAAVRDDEPARQRTYLDLLRLTAAASLPIQVGALILIDLAIRLLVGEQWLGAASVMQAYLAAWLLYTLLELGHAALSAVGRPEIRFKINLLQFPFFALGAWIGLRVWGSIAGVAWTLVVVRLVFGVVYFAAILRVLHIPLRTLQRYLQSSVLAVTGMGLLVYGLRLLLEQNYPALGATFGGQSLEVALLVLAGMLSYAAIFYALDRTGFKAVFRLVEQILFAPRKQPAFKAVPVPSPAVGEQ